MKDHAGLRDNGPANDQMLPMTNCFGQTKGKERNPNISPF